MNEDELRDAAGRELQTFVQWSVSQELADIPGSARTKAVMIMADDLAAMLSAEQEPQIIAAHAGLVRRGPAGNASLFRNGRPQLLMTQAAMGNALAASWNELDEGYRKAVCHAGLYTLPVLFAIAESENIATSEVIRASVLAYETTARFAKTWSFPALKIHPHALFCAVGATASIGFLRRLPADIMLAALSNAATLGVVGPYSQAIRGALVRNTWAAAGISNGFHAIEWAQAGIAGLSQTPHDVYFETLGSDADPASLTEGLGQEWAVASGYHKVNACCQYAHSAIEAMQQILHEQPDLLGGADVQSIRVRTHRLGLTLNDYQPMTTLGAKFSLPHALATSLVHGHGGAAAFDSRALQDERVKHLRAQVDMSLVLQELPWPQDRPAYLTVVRKDGREHTAVCLSARGGPDLPFDDEQLWGKIRGLSQATMPSLLPAMQRLHTCVAEAAQHSDLDRPWGQWVDLFFSNQPIEQNLGK